MSNISALRRTVKQLNAKAEGCKKKAHLMICVNEKEQEEKQQQIAYQ